MCADQPATTGGISAGDRRNRMRAIDERIRAWFPVHPWRVAGFEHEEAGCVIGYSHERSTDYRWDGMLRPRLHHDPVCVMQVTLGGWGLYQRGPIGLNDPEQVELGRAFCCIIPTEHRYWLPSESPGWTVAWMMFRHPYAVARISRCLPPGGAVIDPGGDLRLSNAILRVMVDVASHRTRFDRECALILLALEMERHLQEAPDAEREALANQIRFRVEAEAPRVPSIESLAEEAGLSRTQFTRRVTALLGVSPARFILRIRIERARSMILTTHEPIAGIARATGFQDPSHFSKVFLRELGLHPRSIRIGGSTRNAPDHPRGRI